MQDLLSKTEKQKYFEFKNDKYSVIRGDKYYFINNKTRSLDEIETGINNLMINMKGKTETFKNSNYTINSVVETKYGCSSTNL